MKGQQRKKHKSEAPFRIAEDQRWVGLLFGNSQVLLPIFCFFDLAYAGLQLPIIPQAAVLARRAPYPTGLLGDVSLELNLRLFDRETENLFFEQNVLQLPPRSPPLTHLDKLHGFISALRIPNYPSTWSGSEMTFLDELHGDDPEVISSVQKELDTVVLPNCRQFVLVDSEAWNTECTVMCPRGQNGFTKLDLAIAASGACHLQKRKCESQKRPQRAGGRREYYHHHHHRSRLDDYDSDDDEDPFSPGSHPFFEGLALTSRSQGGPVPVYSVLRGS